MTTTVLVTVICPECKTSQVISFDSMESLCAGDVNGCSCNNCRADFPIFRRQQAFVEAKTCLVGTTSLQTVLQPVKIKLGTTRLK